ncbi:hypothetical protein GCM10011348_17950 [Marinobacterium nitratireducens]|uniref:Zinc finger DksA/TraR C4-type domain-containing protein n=1 Tax=Marinobacterium nitratireducens TaxID=518897 RepID=A0A917ZDW4_9GAMM|nr:TraR/DksA C4-type zinc finger protein [Marinobacterium nitratireducens]GGO80692.1 hypothetical protein GCM10011348_17950 [Marinobacterium nitratireducens]
MSQSLSPRQLRSFRVELEELLAEAPAPGAPGGEACRNALARLDAGVFGVCSVCGEFIELNRLVASPTETLCLSCRTAPQRRHERE